MMRIAGSIVAIAICAFAIPANSHEGKGHGHATGVVKERMELMEAVSKRMKAINTRIKNKEQLGVVKGDGRAIAASAPKIVSMFPPGSTQPPTEAKTTIWQNFPDFESRRRRWK